MTTHCKHLGILTCISIQLNFQSLSPEDVDNLSSVYNPDSAAHIYCWFQIRFIWEAFYIFLLKGLLFCLSGRVLLVLRNLYSA